MNNGLCIGLAAFVMLLISGCNNETRNKFGATDEELLMLVAEPSSEGDYATAIARADSLLAMELSDSLRTYLMSERCVALGNSGHTDAAIAYADSVIAFSSSKKIDEITMNIEGTAGICWRRKENYDSAISHYMRGLDIATRTGDKEYEQYFTELLCITYADRMRPDEAKQYIRRSIKLAEELGDTASMMSALGTLGSLLVRDERGDSTAIRTRSSETISQLKPHMPLLDAMDPVTQFKFLSPLACAYLALDSVATARQYISQLREIAAQLPATKIFQQNLLLVEEELADRENRQADRLTLLEQLDSAGTYRTVSHEFSMRTAECLAALGRYREAFTKADKAYREAKISHEQEVESQMAEMATKYNTALKDLEIQRLATRGWVMTLIIAGLVFAAVVAAILLISISRARRRREEMARQVEYIRGLEQERTRIAHELHDDIAGDLIGLQYALGNIDRDTVAKRIAALAHKTRALSHELIPPEFSRHTLPELITSLSHSRHKDTGVEITVLSAGDFDWGSLAASDSQELYRIVQEAINNAIKYADRNTPITISMGGTEKYEITVSCRPGSAAHHTDGIGHRIMRTRANIAGATLTEERTDDLLRLIITQEQNRNKTE